MHNKQMEMMAREHDISGVDAELVEEMVQAAAEGVVSGYKKLERSVVDGYKKIEQGVVDGYTKIEDKFVSAYLTKDGETVAEAKERLKKENH